MLCLSRKPGETVVIGDEILVTVVHLYPGRVILGVDAPDDVLVDRTEVHEMRTAVATAEPLHRVEQRMDHTEACRPNEADMITAPRAKAMARQVETLQHALEHLRDENAKLRAEIQNREHVE